MSTFEQNNEINMLRLAFITVFWCVKIIYVYYIYYIQYILLYSIYTYILNYLIIAFVFTINNVVATINSCF